jgi:hypothetical protein
LPENPETGGSKTRLGADAASAELAGRSRHALIKAPPGDVDSGAAANHNRRATAVRAARASRAYGASLAIRAAARMERRGSTGSCLVLALLILSAPIAAADPQLRSTALRVKLGHDLPRLSMWLGAAARHVPGQDDQAAVPVKNVVGAEAIEVAGVGR